jgi:hypothetical protein
MRSTWKASRSNSSRPSNWLLTGTTPSWSGPGMRCRRRQRAGTPAADLHPRASQQENSYVAYGARRRAQTGHRAVCRPARFDGAAGRAPRQARVHTPGAACSRGCAPECRATMLCVFSIHILQDWCPRSHPPMSLLMAQSISPIAYFMHQSSPAPPAAWHRIGGPGGTR